MLMQTFKRYARDMWRENQIERKDNREPTITLRQYYRRNRDWLKRQFKNIAQR